MQEIFFGISLRKTDRFSEIQITGDPGDKNQNSRKSIWPQGYIKLFPCSSQLSTKFQLLIKSKMPTN